MSVGDVGVPFGENLPAGVAAVAVGSAHWRNRSRSQPARSSSAARAAGALTVGRMPAWDAVRVGP